MNLVYNSLIDLLFFDVLLMDFYRIAFISKVKELEKECYAALL